MVLGVGHVPLPRAEFHAVAHHDDDGQECALHEHLLRWHPKADARESAPLLHWHWVLPRPLDPRQPVESDDPEAPRVARALDDLLMAEGVVSPILVAPTGRVDRLHVRAHLASLAHSACLEASDAERVGARGSGHSHGALVVRHVALPTLLQRWTC